jgi:phosphatidylinositol glycan class U
MKLIAFILGTAITILGLLYVSYILTGDWKFIKKSYIDYYFP